jgi:putative Mg2+ transporter-C (MgtC) family protein
MPVEIEIAARIALGLVLAAAIGLEREIDGHPAGLRTHIMVGLGATLFGIISTDGFDRFIAERATTNVQVDVTRVASQVVVGIGFLGAGTIVKHGGAVRGLTTAASLWVVSAVGLSVGVGAPVPAVMVTVVMLVALVGLRAPRRWLRDRLGGRIRSVVMRVPVEADASELVAAVRRLRGIQVRAVSIRTTGEGKIIEVDVKPSPGVDLETLVAELADRDEIDGFDIA